MIVQQSEVALAAALEQLTQAGDCIMYNSHVIDYYCEQLACLADYGQELQACGDDDSETWREYQVFAHLMDIEHPL